MASDQKQEPTVVVAEYKISMHCNACERSVAKIIAKFKGVERFMTDMNENRVVVTGRIDQQKLLKKLRKKTGKRVEMVIHDHDDDNNNNKKKKKKKKKKGGGLLQDGCNDNGGHDEGAASTEAKMLNQYYCIESETMLMMFSDENPNACSIM